MKLASIKLAALLANLEKYWFLAKGSVPAAKSSGSIYTFSILNLLDGEDIFLSFLEKSGN